MTTLAPTRARHLHLPHEVVRTGAVCALLGLEVLLGRLAVLHQTPGSHISAYWPNSGISLVVLGLTAPRWRPTALGGIFLASVSANVLGGRPLDIALAFGAANVAEAAVIIWWLTRGRDVERPVLHSLEDIIELLAAILIGAGAAGLITGLTVALGQDGSLLVTARTVLASHAASLLVIAPLGMDLVRHSRRYASNFEAAAQWISLFAVTAMVFAPAQSLPLSFLQFPLLVWGAARLTPREVSVQLMLFATLVAVLTSRGLGPFVGVLADGDHAPEIVGTLLQADLVAAALVALPLSLVKAQRLVSMDDLTRHHGLISSILDSTTGTAIVGFDMADRVEFFNPGAERLTGHRGVDLVDRGMVSLVPHGEELRVVFTPYDRPPADRTTDFVETLLASGDRASMDVSMQRSDGEVRTAAVTINRRIAPDGTTVGYLAVGDDVTERRRQEQLVRAALDKEREAVERLARLDETKNDFLASVSHELRTPITSILGYSQLMLADDSRSLHTMHAQILGRIERNGRRLMGLIEDLLTMSQVEFGDLRFELKPMDLREPVRAALEASHAILDANQLRLTVRLPDEPVPVTGDCDKLERAFANLIVNAAKFSHAGGSIDLLLRTCDGDAVFSVTDRGPGIRAEDQQHLFDRFYRGADARARAIQGAGLGLPIARSIVDGHSGSIEVTSAVGQGSTFAVRLPLSVSCRPGPG